MIEILTVIYAVVAIFLLGFGIADQVAFTSPNYKLVLTVAAFWPLFFVYALGRRFT